MTVFGGDALFGGVLADALAARGFEDLPHAPIASAHNSAITIKVAAGLRR